jgi:hypothetical protein
VAYRDVTTTLGDLYLQLGYKPPAIQHAFSDRSPAGITFSRAIVSFGLAAYNCLAQTLALALALVSLARRTNAVPYAFVAIIECLGILALFIGAGAGVVAAVRTKYAVSEDRGDDVAANSSASADAPDAP